MTRGWNPDLNSRLEVTFDDSSNDVAAMQWSVYRTENDKTKSSVTIFVYFIITGKQIMKRFNNSIFVNVIFKKKKDNFIVRFLFYLMFLLITSERDSVAIVTFRCFRRKIVYSTRKFGFKY